MAWQIAGSKLGTHVAVDSIGTNASSAVESFTRILARHAGLFESVILVGISPEEIDVELLQSEHVLLAGLDAASSRMEAQAELDDLPERFRGDVQAESYGAPFIRRWRFGLYSKSDTVSVPPASHGPSALPSRGWSFADMIHNIDFGIPGVLLHGGNALLNSLATYQVRELDAYPVEPNHPGRLATEPLTIEYGKKHVFGCIGVHAQRGPVFLTTNDIAHLKGHTFRTTISWEDARSLMPVCLARAWMAALLTPTPVAPAG